MKKYKHCKYDHNISVTDPESGESIIRQVDCQIKDEDRKCEKCGWNPRVARDRKRAIEKEYCNV